MPRERPPTARKLVTGLVAAVVATGLLPAIARPEVAPAGTLTIAGCGAGAPITEALAEAFRRARPGIRVEVTTVGSTAGIALATAGAVDLGLTSRPLRAGEDDVALVVEPYARTAIVLAASASLPVDELTSAELLALMRGRPPRWASGVSLLLREGGDSTIIEASRAVPGFAAAYAAARDTSQARILYSEAALLRALRLAPSSIALASGDVVLQGEPGVKALRFDGVAPTPDSVARARYPLVHTLAFVFRDDLASPLAREFLHFARSPAGARLIETRGYLTASRLPASW